MRRRRQRASVIERDWVLPTHGLQPGMIHHKGHKEHKADLPRVSDHRTADKFDSGAEGRARHLCPLRAYRNIS
jgi:hypothetical protein